MLTPQDCTVPDPNWADSLMAIMSSISAIAAVVGILMLLKQFRDFNANLEHQSQLLRLTSLQVIVETESQVADCKHRLDEALTAAKVANHNAADIVDMVATNEQYKNARENYLGALERLAFLIVQDNVTHRDWKGLYGHAISQQVRGTPKIFGPDTRYQCITTLHAQWHGITTPSA